MEAATPNVRRAIPLVFDGMDRAYALQLPSRPANDPMPLLVELHGRGIDAERFDRMTGFGELAVEAGFALALPNALGEIWNDGRNAGPPGPKPDDVGYLTAVIDDALGRGAIDPRRIYVAGMSNGAVMAGRLACELADRLPALSRRRLPGRRHETSRAVRRHPGRIDTRTRPARPVPVLSIHGSADRVAPYEGGIRRGLLSRAMIRHAAEASVGVDDWARFWVEANGAAEGPAVTALPPDVTIRTWHGPTPSSDLSFYRVDGGGHTWPGSRFELPAFLFGRTSHAFDGARVIWEFLETHTAG